MYVCAQCTCQFFYLCRRRGKRIWSWQLCAWHFTTPWRCWYNGTCSSVGQKDNKPLQLFSSSRKDPDTLGLMLMLDCSTRPAATHILAFWQCQHVDHSNFWPTCFFPGSGEWKKKNSDFSLLVIMYGTSMVGNSIRDFYFIEKITFRHKASSDLMRGQQEWRDRNTERKVWNLAKFQVVQRRTRLFRLFWPDFFSFCFSFFVSSKPVTFLFLRILPIFSLLCTTWNFAKFHTFLSVFLSLHSCCPLIRSDEA